MKKCLLAVALGCLCASVSFSQVTISYKNPDSLYVCGQDTLFIFFKNMGAAPAAVPTVLVEINNGLEYVVGSVAGASEQSVINLTKPIFGLGTLAANETKTIAIQLTATCAAIESIDGGQLFVAKITAATAGSATVVTTLNFPVETGLLIFESVAPTSFSGTAGDQFQRTIRIKNTRLGKISGFRFRDNRTSSGLKITTSSGSVVTNGGTIFEADFDGSFFKNFGDGDPFLEKDEVVEIVETVEITDCGSPEKDILSKLRVGWGCGGEECRYDSTGAVVHVDEYLFNPQVVLKIKRTPPLDQCGKKAATQTVFLKNIGQAAAKNLKISLFNIDTTHLGGFKMNSFRLVSSAGVTTELLPALDTLNTLANCNLSVYEKADLVLPDLAAGDSVRLEVDIFYCADPCHLATQGFNGSMYYNKACPANGFVSQLFNLTPSSLSDSSAFRFGALVETHIGTCIVEGKSYNYEFVARSKMLKETVGVLTFEVKLPKGLAFDPACLFKINGQTPLSTSLSGNQCKSKSPRRWPIRLPKCRFACFTPARPTSFAKAMTHCQNAAEPSKCPCRRLATPLVLATAASNAI